MAIDKKEQLTQAEEDFFNLCNLRDKEKKRSPEWLRYTKILNRKIREIKNLKNELKGGA
jgi:hypothetical protein